MVCHAPRDESGGHHDQQPEKPRAAHRHAAHVAVHHLIFGGVLHAHPNLKLVALGDTTATARLLLLVDYRPAYGQRWGNKTYLSHIRLDPLEEESAEEMLAAMLGNEAVSESDEKVRAGLSRLLQKQGKKEEARRMLAEIYDWFTEGFDTADLKEAKALLEEQS